MVIALLVVLVVAAAVWKVLAVHELEQELAEQRVSLISKSRVALQTQTTDLLRLSTTPLGWAVRSAMLANASSDIDAYMAELIRAKYVKRVALVDLSGTVIAATNLKLTGQPASAAFPGTIIDTSEPRITHIDDVTRAVVPVMDVTRRIGTLIYDYSDDSITRHFDSPARVK